MTTVAASVRKLMKLAAHSVRMLIEVASPSKRTLERRWLLPFVLGVHAVALSFAAISGVRGSADAASVVAFVLAASVCVVAYVVLPFAVCLKFVQAMRRSRREPSI
jgi:hypothetical protein